ncbi:MAG: hypothetical protein ACRDP7_48640 [Trebonia sp.]
MHYYVPPRFDLFEFDDESLGLSPRSSQRRFSGWNGLVGQPAEEVILAWSASGATVLVATSGRDEPMEFSRLSAAHLALGGTALPVPDRPGSTEAVVREIERISATEELWTPGPAMAPGGSPSHAAAGNAFSVAYAPVGGEMVLVAAVGVRADQFRVRKVTDWGVYDLDATVTHPLSELPL